MNLSPSQGLDRVRHWEQQATELHGILLADYSVYVIKFKGRVSVHGEGIMLTGENGLELTGGIPSHRGVHVQRRAFGDTSIGLALLSL